MIDARVSGSGHHTIWKTVMGRLEDNGREKVRKGNGKWEGPEDKLGKERRETERQRTERMGTRKREVREGSAGEQEQPCPAGERRGLRLSLQCGAPAFPGSPHSYFWLGGPRTSTCTLTDGPTRRYGGTYLLEGCYGRCHCRADRLSEQRRCNPTRFSGHEQRCRARFMGPQLTSPSSQLSDQLSQLCAPASQSDTCA